MELNAYYRRRKKKALVRRFIFIGVIGVAGVLTVWGSFWAPFLRISNLDIENYADSLLVEKALASYMHSVNDAYLPNNHFFLASAETVSDILKNSGLGLTEIEKKFPATLVVKFLDFEPWLIFCKKSNDCFYVNKRGVVSGRAPHFSESPLPEIIPLNLSAKLGDEIVSIGQLKFLLELLDYLVKMDILAKRIVYEVAPYVKMFTKEGWYLRISSEADPQKIVLDLKLLLDQKIKEKRGRLEYVDLRFENKAFYKLR